jgi:hypothetical protein
MLFPINILGGFFGKSRKEIETERQAAEALQRQREKAERRRAQEEAKRRAQEEAKRRAQEEAKRRKILRETRCKLEPLWFALAKLFEGRIDMPCAKLFAVRIPKKCGNSDVESAKHFINLERLCEWVDWLKWSPQVLTSWLEEHHKYIELVFVLEKLGRFAEAADILEKLGPAAYFERFDSTGNPITCMALGENTWVWDAIKQKDAFTRKLAQLKGNAAAAAAKARIAPPDAVQKHPTLTPAQIEDQYAYGEISKEEYECLKAKAASTAAKTCGTCGRPVNPEFAFCPHCGAKA